MNKKTEIRLLPFTIINTAARSALCITVAASCLHAAGASLLDEARQARAESIPEVAIQKVRAFLEQPDLSAEQRQAGARELAAGLLDAGHIDDALTAIQPLASSGDPDARLLLARAFAAAGKWTNAEPIYRALCEARNAPTEATMGLAESLQALNRSNDAAKVLDAFREAHPEDGGAALRLANLLMEMGDAKRAGVVLAAIKHLPLGDEKLKSYLTARLLLSENQAAPALEIFEELRRDPSHASEALHFGAVLGSSAAQSALNGSDAADTVLEKFIRDDPDSRFLEDAFRQLDVVYAQQANPSESELRKWVEKPPPRRAALALYYLARAQGRARRPDLAARTLDQFVQNYPGNPLNAEANLMRTDLFLQRGDLPGAVRALDAAMRHAGSDSQRAEIEMRTGLVQDRQNEALLAHDSFWRAAKWPGRLRVDATYDAALEALRMKNYERFFADFRALRAEFHDTPLLSDLELEEGLAQARAGDARAADTLELFLRHYPKHPRQSEARLALADLAYFRGDSAGASRLLKVANESAPTPATSESAAYLAIFLADKKTPRGDEQVIELGDRFLQEYPHSAREPEVRMKLGQVHFRNNHYPNAETEFTVLAHENPSGPYAEPALFLAGRSAMKTLNPGSIDRALTLFDDVVKRDGPLKLYALQQQASIKHSLGNEGETIAIYDNILAAQPPPEPELRFASLCGKGDSLMILGRGEPALLETAIGVFDILAALPDVTPEWRNQALYKKGKALEQLSRRSEAITAYYDVLDKSGTDGREFFWYYKAGFDAATLFTQQNQWKSAIGIYEKIARVEGPRAAEARALAKKIRLERFIWD